MKRRGRPVQLLWLMLHHMNELRTLLTGIQSSASAQEPSVVIAALAQFLCSVSGTCI